MWSRTREPGAGSLERSTSRPGQASDERLRPQLGLWLVPHACTDSPSTGRGAGDAVRAGRPGAGDLPGPPPFTRQVVDPLQGPAEQWAEELADLALSDGVSAFNSPPRPRRRAPLRCRGRPAVRELVAAERSADPVATAEPELTTTGSSGDGPASHRHGCRPQPYASITTPYDSSRRSDVHLWDESTRPAGPAPDPDRTYPAHEQASGKHLIDVHDALRPIRTVVTSRDRRRSGAVDVSEHTAPSFLDLGPAGWEAGG